jgi:hypothetical protein
MEVWRLPPIYIASPYTLSEKERFAAEVGTGPGAVGFPHRAGGGGRQSGGSMGAVSGAPLTGTTYTLYKRSWIADWARILANILRPVMSTNKSLLNILRTNNKRLKTI